MLPTPQRVVTAAKALAIGLAACLVCTVVGLGAGVWLGIEWEQGSQAQDDVAGYQAANEDLTKALQTERREHLQIYTNASRDLRVASDRLDAIAEITEAQRHENRRFARELRATLENELARRPDLDGVRVGDGLLCAWNRALVGAPEPAAGAAGAPGAAALPGCQPAGAVPAPAAGDRGQPARADP